MSADQSNPEPRAPRPQPALVKGQCKHCGQPFDYVQQLIPAGQDGGGRVIYRRVTRVVCDECKRTRKQWLHKQEHARRPRALGGERARPGEFQDRNQIARELGISLGQLRGLEWSALQKLRNSPQLQEAYANYKEDGMPLLDELVAALRSGADGAMGEEEELLKRQLELLEYWRVHDAVKAGGLTAEAKALQAEIRKWHGLIAREVEARLARAVSPGKQLKPGKPRSKRNKRNKKL